MRQFASPLARTMASQRGYDLSQIQGSGPYGRVIKRDVEGFQPQQQQTAQPAPQIIEQKPKGPNAQQLADLLEMSYQTEDVSAIREVIAQRLQEAKQIVPHFYLTMECRIDKLLKMRKSVNEAAEGKYKLSVNDFIIKASALALKDIPDANASWSDDTILKYLHADISVAVATPHGLMTPIIKQAELKSLPAISAEMKELAKKARDNKLKPQEFQGGTFSVSNLGMYGISQFNAIINPPQACILAVGAGLEKPVVNNGKIEIGTMMNVTLSCDHRVVDGAVGAELLQAFQAYIEDPVSMFL